LIYGSRCSILVHPELAAEDQQVGWVD
jgi:hypothetical protein